MSLRDRKTPLTDAAVVSSEFIHREMDKYKHKFILANHARRLERDRAAAVEALKLLYDHCRLYHPDVEQNNVGEMARAVLAEIEGEKG